MKNWKIYQNYLLLSAFAFKILILGSVMTLAVHNICLQKLLDDDINWTRLVGKQRKRNDENSYHLLSNVEAKQEVAINITPQRVFLVPFWHIISHILTPLKFNPGVFFRFPPRYIPEKIFIRLCTLIR